MMRKRRRTVADLGGPDLAVLHAARDLDRSGVYPSGDRVCDRVEDYPDALIRKTLLKLVSEGLVAPVTPDDRPDRAEPEPDDGGDPDGLSADPAYCRKPVDTSVRAFDLALYRIAEGKGSLFRNLSILTGLSENACKKRVARTAFNYDEQRDGESPNVLSPNQQRYYAKLYRDSDDGAVREWAMANAAPLRARPDSRSAKDRDRDRPAA